MKNKKQITDCKDDIMRVYRVLERLVLRYEKELDGDGELAVNIIMSACATFIHNVNRALAEQREAALSLDTEEDDPPKEEPERLLN